MGGHEEESGVRVGWRGSGGGRGRGAGENGVDPEGEFGEGDGEGVGETEDEDGEGGRREEQLVGVAVEGLASEVPEGKGEAIDDQISAVDAIGAQRRPRGEGRGGGCRAKRSW